MNTAFLKIALGWGAGLWLIGYILGFLFFAFVPQAVIGWYVMPFGIAVTLWVLYRYVHGHSLAHYLTLGVIWCSLAIALDYLFIVQLLHPADGYYKTDVYLYYALTLLLPIAAYFTGFKQAADRA